MNQTLNDDMLGEIIKLTFNNCTQVCKRWSNIIIKNSIICSTCGKIVKTGSRFHVEWPGKVA